MNTKQKIKCKRLLREYKKKNSYKYIYLIPLIRSAVIIIKNISFFKGTFENYSEETRFRLMCRNIVER